MFIQQGDVLIKTTKIPAEAHAVARKGRGYVLAEGESTGHAHVIEDAVELLEKDGVLYIRATAPVVVKHEEHGPVTVPAGEFEVGIVQEYDHFAEEARNVRD